MKKRTKNQWRKSVRKMCNKILGARNRYALEVEGAFAFRIMHLLRRKSVGKISDQTVLEMVKLYHKFLTEMAVLSLRRRYGK